MDEISIRQYAVLMNELGLTGLEVNQDGSEVRLERAASSPGVTVQTITPSAPPEEPQVPAAFKSITSPMVGVFYTSPTEDGEPFVKVGDKVTKGTTLCIVEAMKLMNEITAEEDGIISEICVQNGQVVDYGCELFRITR